MSLMRESQWETVREVLEWEDESASAFVKEVHRLFQQFAELQGFELGNYLGAGINGVVFRLLPKPAQRSMTNQQLLIETHKPLICKLFRVGREEGQLQKEFAKVGMAPRVHFIGRSTRFGGRSINLLCMEAVDCTLERVFNTVVVPPAEVDAAVRQTIEMIDRAYQANLTHGDVHWDNVGLQYKSKKRLRSSTMEKHSFVISSKMPMSSFQFVLIDFGEAFVFPNKTRAYPVLLDLLQLLRNARPSSSSHSPLQPDTVAGIEQNWRRAKAFVEREILTRYPSLKLTSRKQVSAMYKNQRRLYDATIKQVERQQQQEEEEHAESNRKKLRKK